MEPDLLKGGKWDHVLFVLFDQLSLTWQARGRPGLRAAPLHLGSDDARGTLGTLTPLGVASAENAEAAPSDRPASGGA